MNIDRSLRLTPNRYVREMHPKERIFLHHTQGASAQSTFNWWQSQEARIAAAYIIDRDGTIFEVFDPEYWAFQLGLRTPDARFIEQSSIGIELANYGPLIKTNNQFFALDGKQRFNGPVFEYEWRDYSYWEAYTSEQMQSSFELVNYLCDNFRIPKQILEGDPFRYNVHLRGFRGVLTHCNVRFDKTDPHPGYDMVKLNQYIRSRIPNRQGTW